MQSVDNARLLLTANPIEPITDDAIRKNPFNRVYVSENLAIQEVNTPSRVEEVVSLAPDRDILVGAQSQVRPTGSMKLGGNVFLLIGQKKLKVGDIIQIVFNGQTYELSISAIDSTNFTLRYKSEEITRPIKPAANKP